MSVHVEPSPSYPGLQTHLATGSSGRQDAFGSQISISKQDTSVLLKLVKHC